MKWDSSNGTFCRHEIQIFSLLRISVHRRIFSLSPGPATVGGGGVGQIHPPRRVGHGDQRRSRGAMLVVYPEVKDKAPALVLIHEIFGLTDWAREEADELAAAGYVVIAPDLLSGMGPNKGGTSDFPAAGGAVMQGIQKLPSAQVTGVSENTVDEPQALRLNCKSSRLENLTRKSTKLLKARKFEREEVS